MIKMSYILIASGVVTILLEGYHLFGLDLPVDSATIALAGITIFSFFAGFLFLKNGG